MRSQWQGLATYHHVTPPGVHHKAKGLQTPVGYRHTSMAVAVLVAPLHEQTAAHKAGQQRRGRKPVSCCMVT